MHANPDVLALLALGEATGFEDDREHLLHCDPCRRELAEIVRIVDLGRRADLEDPMVMPGPHVWEAIHAELGFADPTAAEQRSLAAVTPEPVITGPVAPEPTTLTEPISLAKRRRARTNPPDAPGARSATSGRRPSRALLIGALAAAVSLVAGIGIGFGVNQLSGDRETVISEAQLKALPDWTGSNGRAEIEQNDQGKRRLVISVDSPRPVGGTRQVWLIDKQVKGMVSLGFLRNGEATLSIPDMTDLSQYPIVDVSAEPGNDPDPKHSGISIVRGTLAP